MRPAVLKALANMGNPAVEPLIGTLNDTCNRRNLEIESWKSWKETAEQLGVSQPQRHAGQREIKLCRGRGCGFIECVGTVRDPHSARSLAFLLKDRSKRVFQAAASTMSKMGWQPDGGDESAILSGVDVGKWDSIIEIGAPAIDPVMAALKDINDEIRDCGGETKEGKAALEPFEKSWAQP